METLEELKKIRNQVLLTNAFGNPSKVLLETLEWLDEAIDSLIGQKDERQVSK